MSPRTYESRLISIVLVVVVLSSLCHSNPTSHQDRNTSINAQAIAIQTVISTVKTAIADVQTRLHDSGLPPLHSVVLTLQAVASRNGGARVKLWIVSFGHAWKKEKSQTVVIELAPPAPGAPAKVGTESLTEAFEDAIISAAQGVKDAATGPVPLKLKTLSVELGFTVQNSTSIGGQVQLSPVTLETEADWSQTAVHRVLVVFAAGEH